jgi:hypothetical protein
MMLINMVTWYMLGVENYLFNFLRPKIEQLTKQGYMVDFIVLNTLPIIYKVIIFDSNNKEIWVKRDMDIKVLFGDLYCESCRILEGDKVNEIKI